MLNAICILPGDTTAQLVPPSTVNSKEMNVRISPCFGSEKETSISVLPAECEDQFCPHPVVRYLMPAVPRGIPELVICEVDIQQHGAARLSCV